MKETETASATPEQLLQMIENQLRAERNKRAEKSKHRSAILVGGILFIVIAAGGALLVLQNMLLDLQTRDPQPQEQASVPAVHGNL